MKFKMFLDITLIILNILLCISYGVQGMVLLSALWGICAALNSAKTILDYKDYKREK
jgi:glucose-6-phosphate-specific signal transduction histidine kinase